MIAIALAVALAATPAPAAPAAGRAAGDGAPAAADAAGKNAPAEKAVEDVSADADVMGFLSLTNTTAGRDGGVKLPWDGPGGVQMKLSWDALDKRNEHLAMGDMMARALVDAVRVYFDTEGGMDPEGMRAKLMSLTGAPLEDARATYMDAVTWEERRLFFVERAVALARQDGGALPGVDAELVRRRALAIRSGAVAKALAARIDGYRDLALGIVAYIDGDNFKAIEKVRTATGALPELAIGHAFLGSLYFLFDQKDAAVRSWRTAYELDPSIEAVKAALKEYGRKAKPQAQQGR